MNIQTIRDRLPDYARDLKLNLGSVLTPQGAPGLNETQIMGTALASAIASRNEELTAAIKAETLDVAGEATVQGARIAAALMGMNNIYYRFTHLVGDAEYATLPARLRMSAMASPGVAKTDFELYSLAVSAINGCAGCVKAHERTLRKEGLSREAIQSAARIAAVVHAVAVALEHASADNTRVREAA